MSLKNRLRATGLPRTTWVLSMSGLLVAIGFGVVIPVLTPFARTFGATTFQLGLVVSLFAAMRLVTSPFASRFGRRVGERNAITIGMLIVAVSTVVIAVAPSLWMVMLARALGGIGSATFTISALNLLLATAPDASGTRRMRALRTSKHVEATEGRFAGDSEIPILPRTMVYSTMGLVVLGVAMTVFAGPLFDLSNDAANGMLERLPYVEAVSGTGAL